MNTIDHNSLQKTLQVFLLMFSLIMVPGLTRAAPVIIDNGAAVYSNPGDWDLTNDGDAYGGQHRKSNDNNPGTVRWYPNLGAANAGTYEVWVWWVKYPNNMNVTYNIKHNAGAAASVAVNQKTPGDGWKLIGSWAFNGANNEYVELIGPKRCSADAVQFIKVITNTPPVANADSLTVAEGGTKTILNSGATSVLTNDTDAEGDALTAAIVSNPTNGALTLNANGTFSYTHNGGESTSDSFTYKAFDGTDYSGNVVVSITITPVNDTPVANSDNYTVLQDSIANVLTILSNDTDPDIPANTLTITGVDTTGTKGTVVNNGTSVSFTPTAAYTGNTTFSYTISDGNGGTASAIVTVAVNMINKAPDAVNDTFSILEDSGANVLAVLANDTDPNVGDIITIINVTAPAHGTTIHNGTTVTYTPAAGYIGPDSFTYTISDPAGLTDSANVSINVTNVNDPPVAAPDTITAANGSTSTILTSGSTTVLANDTDDEGDPLTAVLVANVAHGILTLNNDGTFSYTHDGSAAAADSFTYKAYDGVDYSNIVTVSITITAPGVHDVSPMTMTDFTSLPLNMTDAVAPLVMITASNDHQLYFKAYNDYADLDGDNIVDTTYKPTITYYGYFDSYKCYDYVVANNRFEPKAVAGQDYSMDGTVTGFTPASGQMTINITNLTGIAGLGPFNNWTVTNLSTGATGSSSTSTTLASNGNKNFTTTATNWITVGDTIRVSVSVASYCTGANDGYWSGNFLNWISMSRIDTINKVLFGGKRRVDTAASTVLERAYLPHDAHSWAKYYAGNDIEMLTPFTAGANFTLNDADPKKNGITFCNTTDATGAITKSEEITDPPLIKVAKGNYSLWAGNERWQCTWDSGAPADNRAASNGNVIANSGINAYSSSPAYGQGLGQKNYVARVQACVPGLIGREKCKQYPGGNYKPIGLLQAYGDDDQLLFGMVSGTYHKHVSGGSLIKNIESITDEINVNTDGTFPKLAIAAGGPKANNKADGIINAWSLFRMVGYNHGDGTYLGAQYDNCSWGLSAFANVSGANECRNWGNPFAEIYFQGVRYFSDAGVTGAYQDNTSVGIDGLPTPQNWANPNPLGATNYCARANIIAFNSSTSSYDNDELDANNPGVKEIWSTNILPGADTSAAMTDVIGLGEGIHGNSYFIGETAVDNQADGEDQLCTAKTVNSLGNAGGLCPESSRLRGSYRIAGIAYYAHTQDIRADYLTGGRALDGTQTLDTYAVTNASSTPKIGIPHPITGGTAVEILPACRNTSLNPAGNCAIVDFKIVSQVVNDGTGKGTGKFYVNWEDSEQGGDYDQDMWGTIDYEINGITNTLKITTDVHAESTIYKMGFGYILSGTTNDGFHVHSGIEGFSFADTATITSGGSCAVSCVPADAPSTASYTLGASTAELLKEPLWYAAKWGGFIDRNGDGTPDLNEEWDVEDTKGNPTPDGIPDNYFFAFNPQQLEDSLNRVFLKILQRTSSGTAAAVVSNNVRGEGALYQAYYEPQKKDADGRTVNWIGTLHGLWLDSHGYLREDNGDGALGNYIDDPVIETYFDEAENRTRVKRWVSTVADHFTPDNPDIIELGGITPLWNARDQMTYSTLTDNELAAQRPYGTSADSGRYITTWIDSDLDGIVDAGEHVDFTDSTITGANYTFFDMATQAEVKGLIKYLRGVETSGYRSRTVDYNGDGVTEVIRLGDIINSTPTMVAAPAEGFDLLYRDNSYSSFRKQYHNRRNVLYVGANDGLLHAFNAGFFDADNLKFTTAGKKIDGNDATPHPLGSELWAYAPMNLHSHLKWLKDPGYTHVYYVDGKPRVFDAKIFNNDAIHPNGWGTILVVGMRFGGGAMTIDTGGDGLNGDANDKTRRSAYIIFDITDPETPPTLLGEIQTPDGSFTTVYPAVMTFKDKTANAPNKWYLVFGSGPNSLTTGESSANAKLYIFDLDEFSIPGQTVSKPAACTITTSGSAMEVISCDTGQTNSFMGTPMVVDWDLDYKADTLYFGTVGGVSSNKGRVFRLAADNNEDPILWSGPNTLIDVAQPVYAPPTAAVDSNDLTTANKWVFFGTGRLIVNDDKTSTTTQSLYGVKDTGAIILSNELVDVTNVEVQNNGDLVWTPTAETGQDVLNRLNFNSVVKTASQTYFDILDSEMSQYACYDNAPVTTYHTTATSCDTTCTAICSSRKGWKLNLLPITGTAGVAPATRMLNQQALLGEILFSSAYQPSIDLCVSEGESRLYGISYKTGTALGDTAVFGTENYIDPSTGLETPYETNKRYINLGFGMATSPAIHSGSGSGDAEVSVFTQLSTGTIIRQAAKTEGKVRSGKKAWRER